jgi:hypothetical protein
MPLGQILLDRNVVDPEQLEAARSRQKIAGGSLAESLVALGAVSRHELDALLAEVPAQPVVPAETGLGAQFLLHFLLKTLYVYGHETAREISATTKLHEDVVDAVLQDAKEKRLVEVLGLTPARPQVYRWALTDLGRKWAVDALEQCQYTGAAPVPLADYQVQVVKQSIANERVTPASLERSLSHLVLPPGTVARMGPAVNSGRAILLYGAPGNGKSSVAEAIGRSFTQTIFVPHAVGVDGQIIKVFDPTVHEPCAASACDAGGPADAVAAVAADPRWVRCRRPVILTGGELTLEMLDLTFDPVSKYYEAPAHLKAIGGLFILDDFGRQRVRPQDLLNRWILPLERRVDFLTLHTGKKLQMPFDQLVIFSTNFPPKDLMDEAGLRRIPYKFHMTPPSRDEYEAIFHRVCDSRELAVPSEILSYLFHTFYPATGTPVSCAHPRFVVDHVIARCHFAGQAPVLTLELLCEALQNLVVDTVVPLKGDPPRERPRRRGAAGAPDPGE